MPLGAALLHLQRPVHPFWHPQCGRIVVLLEGWFRVAAILLLYLPSPNQKGLGAQDQVYQAVLFPLPAHAETVSHPVNGWKTGRVAQVLGSSLVTTLCTPMYLKLVSVPRASHIPPA